MEMAYLRQLSRHFDPVYIKPANLTRVVSLWRTNPNFIPTETRPLPARREQDRRCGTDRRRRQLPTLLDTRSPHAQRKQVSRRQQDGVMQEESAVGIDVYA